MRLLERQSGRRVGSDLKPELEPVRLRANSDPQFPATEITKCDLSTEPPELWVSFFGLFGPSGALPRHYTNIINERIRAKDLAMRDFFDMFNHRLLSFFYRCWEKHCFPVSYETSYAADSEDSVTKLLRAFVGLRGKTLSGRMSLPDSDVVFFSGIFANDRPSSKGIQSILESVFQVPVAVLEFVPQWMNIAPSGQTRLGTQPLGVSIGNQLGVEAIAGTRVLDFENRFRMRIGPLSLQSFQGFHPESHQLRELFDLIRLFVGPQFDFDVQLVLKKEQVPITQLGNEQTSRLGWNTWIGDWLKPHDAADAIYELPDFAD